MVEGDFIGTDVTGTHSGDANAYLGNQGDGVLVDTLAAANTIGGTTAGALDVISGNFDNGVAIQGASNNLVEGDLIGTNVAGLVGLGNADGVLISNPGTTQTTTNNTIGGTAAGARDVISGNFVYGVEIQGAADSLVEGDYIGTDAGGTQALADESGVVIDGGASANTIGGVTTAAADVISGNDNDGVDIVSSSYNLVEGDYIGVDASGKVGLGNGTDGVQLSPMATHNTVGGTTAGARDVISGNGSNSVEIDNASDNLIAGDYIGTDVTGEVTVVPGGVAPSADHVGVLITEGATSNTIGGTVTAARDIISNGSQWGVYIEDSGTSGNLVEGDFIGTDATGTVALSNGAVGVEVDGANLNTVGGTTAGAGNVISGNMETGVVVLDSSNILVAGNRIGTNAAGTSALPNATGGVLIEGCSQVTIGGTTAAAGNVISGNDSDGLAITLSPDVLVVGNRIGTNAAGTAAVPNATDGLDIGSANDTIGGTVVGASNVISGNGNDGINLGSNYATENVVEGNFIGTDITGMHALGNQDDGVYLSAGASFNTIGGQVGTAGNVISGNLANGVLIDGGNAHNIIEYNDVGTNLTGSSALPNGQNGVVVQGGSTWNFVSSNVISGNNGNGVLITGSGTMDNVLSSDLIGVNAAGTAIVAQTGESYSNDGVGVEISDGATGTWVGLCVIGGNVAGVEIDLASGNSVVDDDIGTDASGTRNLGNLGYGVVLSQGTGNFVEDDDIEHSGVYGILTIFADQNTVQSNVFAANAAGNEYAIG